MYIFRIHQVSFAGLRISSHLGRRGCRWESMIGQGIALARCSARACELLVGKLYRATVGLEGQIDHFHNTLKHGQCVL